MTATQAMDRIETILTEFAYSDETDSGQVVIDIQAIVERYNQMKANHSL